MPDDSNVPAVAPVADPAPVAPPSFNDQLDAAAKAVETAHTAAVAATKAMGDAHSAFNQASADSVAADAARDAAVKQMQDVLGQA